MNSCDAKAHRIGLSNLTSVERIVTLLSQANFEIECGGLSQYFYNSSGEHTAEALAALKEVGAMQAASAMETALALFPAGITTTGTDEHFCEVLNEYSDDLNSLTSEFYSESPDVFSRLCTYIENHTAELKEHIE
jgi:D-serine deaminase-like pyridoxal phosphate-dependent protein